MHILNIIIYIYIYIYIYLEYVIIDRLNNTRYNYTNIL